LWEFVLDRGLEGMVAKRIGSEYRPGVRSPDWRKIHNLHTVRALVGGYTPGERGRSRTFGALLLGLRDGDKLRWIGAVGTGFSDMALASIRAGLDQNRRAASPFHPDSEIPSATWVEPYLVAAVEYSAWTGAGRLRRPVFKGFTDDDPETITWEAEGPQ
jgi:bifunctional non-homologous end joining protein LigD